VRTVRDAAWVLGVAVACALTAFVNPYGFDLIRTWHVIMGEPVLKQIIQEHCPLDPAQPGAWPVLGYAALYVVTLLGVPVRQVRVSWLLPLVWLVLAFDRVRHAPLFAVVSLAAIAAMWPHTRWADRLKRTRPDLYQPPQPSSDQVGPAVPAVLPGRHSRPYEAPAEEARTPLWANVLLPVVAVLTVLVLQAARVEVPVVGAGWAYHDPHHWPVELIDTLKENEPHSAVGNHLFNDYIDGGFVIYHAPGYKVFVDDRCEVFGGEWLREFVVAGTVDTAAAIRQWEAKYDRFDFALTRTGTGFDEYFAKSDEWRLVKHTETANFYKRK
jgi:hypothetical protein